MNELRLVVDTSVIVAGLRSQLGASNRILTLVAERRLVPWATTALFLEYEDVLNRPEQRFASLDALKAQIAMDTEAARNVLRAR